MQKTANQIKSEFETLASGHYQIHSFLYAQEFEQQAYENLIYPLMLVYPLGGSLSGTTYSRNYRVIIADRVLKSEGNELEVESDTQLIALDVLAYWMKLGQNERFTITSTNTITPFWEKWGDEVTGHFVDIGIEEFYDFNSCAIPLSGSIPTPPNPCKDARISVNSVVYGNAPSDSNFNVVVKDQLGSLVGSLIGGDWIVNTGGSCADATYTIEDTLGNVLYTGTIPSGGNLDRTINNSTLNVNKSDGSLISSRSILAEGTDFYNVADSLVENDAISPTYSQLVKATEGLILPTQEIQNNGVASGFIPSVGTINITTNVPPTSFNVTGRTIDIVVPSGSTPMNVDFSADKLTAAIGENITFTDLSDQSPTHWSWQFSDGTNSIVQNPVKNFLSLGFKNITLMAGKVGTGNVNIKNSYIEIIGDVDAAAFFSRVIAAGGTLTTTEENAVTALVTQLKADGLWANLSAIYPMVGASAAACAQNLKSSSFTGSFSSGWTFANTGIKGNGVSAFFETNFNPSINASLTGFSFGGYPRNNDTSGSQGSGCLNSSLFAQQNLSLGNMLSGSVSEIITYTPNPSQGMFIHRRTSATFSEAYRNGISLGTATSTATGLPNITFNIGARNEPVKVLFDAHEYAFYFLGLSLTNQNALDLTSAVNTFQTSLSRQV